MLSRMQLTEGRARGVRGIVSILTQLLSRVQQRATIEY